MSGLLLPVYIIIFVALIYFVGIRPQQKRMKDHKAMLEAIRRGDRVVTNGGIVGVITKVTENEKEIQVEIAEGVREKVMRDMIAAVLSKTEPVESKSEAAKT